ncbi:FGGY-family carbohydrate kinase [Oryzicola mucosus]|uniref:FGGY-family carbohydrate kinase n=1 Tax=Oryzicola mucosus TaxID=2767425 RepID=A0A8J6PER4_9HYPH|nr:FGGY-family carbohydrate kinase [Oryzicola mucosus]MBD0413629.1 FGGY-family carbohydrate kinase [Oryzicola mucosus]
MSRPYVCAVDVGTGSARAGIFDKSGHMLARAEHAIAIRKPLPDHAEHSSEDIWSAVCKAVRSTRERAGVAASEIAGIGFDATCSLVVLDGDGRPLSVAADGKEGWDTLVWLDHRALGESDACTATRHPVLDFIGGAMSPEMQTPKLMWLKRHLPAIWQQAGHFFDLADFLTWKATGSTARSQCTLTCKWTYLPHDGGWKADFFEAVGLEDMRRRGGLPDQVSPVGASLGTLSPEAADALGLDTQCAVATGMIDAFAGALGVIGGHVDRHAQGHMALIAGTSSCVMSFSAEEIRAAGMWGPYVGAALPGLWISEAGQSATGALLDHVIRLHGAGGEPSPERHAAIIARIKALRGDNPEFAADLHVLPDFHGNRSPFADPHARGVVSGLTLDASFDALCAVYWRTAVAIALGIRHIVEHMEASGHHIEMLHVTGGHTRNPLLMELYADATTIAVSTCGSEDAVLLGTAMNAASASGWFDDLASACKAMLPPQQVLTADPFRKAAYDRDYKVFLAMHRHRRELQAL